MYMYMYVYVYVCMYVCMYVPPAGSTRGLEGEKPTQSLMVQL